MVKKSKYSYVDESHYAKCKCNSSSTSCGGAVYGLGFLGAAVYYVSQATGFWMGVWGIIKACVWPAVLVFELFKFLGI